MFVLYRLEFYDIRASLLAYSWRDSRYREQHSILCEKKSICKKNMINSINIHEIHDDNIYTVLSFRIFVSSPRTNLFLKAIEMFTVGKKFKYGDTFPASSMMVYRFT